LDFEPAGSGSLKSEYYPARSKKPQIDRHTHYNLVRFNPLMLTFYNKILAKGKPKKAALIAVM
jgi:hypothetical protein